MKSLTAEAILSSDDAQYMDKAQLAYFEGLLRRERNTLLERLANPNTGIDDPSSYPDPVDRASMEEERAQAHRERARVESRILEIDRALKRIADDEYGYCVETGEPIGLGRLLIQPTATLCIEAQERREHLQRF